MQQRVLPSELSNVVSLSSGQTDFARRPVTAPVVRIHLLGEMRAYTVRPHSNILPRGRKARAMLAYLCLAEGAAVPRSRLAAMLWDRVPKGQARASFRQAFRELTVSLGKQADAVLSADRDTVRLDTGACWIDAVALLSEGAEDVRKELAEHCKGDLLADLNDVSAAFDQWLVSERTRFAEALRNLLEGKLGQAKEREAIARRLIDIDPTHEGAARILMRALADRNERVQALTEYKRLNDAMRRTLDAGPSAETRALYDVIRKGTDEGAHDVQPVEPATRKDHSFKFDELATKRSHRRVGVMPFVPIPSAVDYNLAFSIAQEVAAALARFRFFDIVAPTGLMRGPAPTFLSDVELRRKDLDYVIDGSVSCSRGVYRISVRLLDLTTDAKPVWSEKFNLPVDRLDLLDETVTAVIAAQIDPVIIYIEGPKKLNEDDDALGCVMRALPLLHTMERPKYEEAGRLIERALELEPDNAVVLSWAAYWHIYYAGQNWSDNEERHSAIALDYARRATQADQTNAEALAIYGHLLSFVNKDVKVALEHFDRALQLNRNTPFVWAYSALSYCYLGDPDKALAQLERCRELTATLPFFSLYENPKAIAWLMKKDYEKAVEIGRRVVQGTPHYANGYKPLIAALGHLRRKEAKRHVEKLRELEPDFTVKKFGARYPFTCPSDLEHYLEGLRRAGVPES